MKPLSESLFDKNVAVKKLPVLDNIKRLFDDPIIKDMSIDEIMEAYDSIIDTGKSYSSSEIERLNIDILKNVVIIQKKRHGIGKYAATEYGFLCGLSNYRKMYYAAIDYIPGQYLWSWYDKWDDWGHCPWSGTVDLIEDWFGICNYIVLPEFVSKEIIDGLKKMF